MIRKSIAAVSLMMLVGTPALAAPCRDAKTKKFIKCPTGRPAPTSGVVKDAKGRCHVSSGKDKGKFVKCP